MDATIFKKIINDEMCRAGYTRKGTNWYRDWPTVISLLNLQKSNYDDLWFINIAFWLKGVGQPKVPPPEHLCHVRIRATSAFPNVRSQLEQSCTLNTMISDERRKAILVKIFEETILPFMTKAGCQDGLLNMIKEGCFDSGFVKQSALQGFSR